MLNSETLKQYIKAAGSLTGWDNFNYDWISNINSGEHQFPLLHLIPFAGRWFEPKKKDYKVYNLDIYFMKRDRVGDRKAKKEERDIIWAEIAAAADLTLEKMFENRKAFYPLDEPDFEFDENRIGNMDLIWVKYSLKVKVLSCGAPTPMPT